MRDMKIETDLDKIEREAGKLGVNLGDLLKDSNVSLKTWQRWRSSAHLPQLGTLKRISEQLESLRKKKAA